MKEQSHKDEMSAALRGDFERLRERGVSVALTPAEPEQPAESEDVAREPDGDADDDPRPGWLGRLLGR